MIKVTIRKDNEESKTINWWVEGFENREINDEDIINVLDMIDTSRKSIIEVMRKRQGLEAEKKMSNLYLIQVDRNV
ncbi:MAG: hypothetical protein M0Q13_02590 [Methanothrix sp.]|jgi:hypothetical protein|nr:hypothetical protein [Methanothrix sp.]